MQLSLFILALGGLTCNALPHPATEQWGPFQTTLYLMSNGVSGNDVVAISVKEDGSLYGGTSVSTGGIGGNYVSPTDGHPLVPDSLSAQDAVIVAGNSLFAVNAGSNSVSMFSMGKWGVQLVGGPKSSMGEFPTTLAASLKGNLVCVANSGAKSGVSCATFSGQGLSNFDMLRSLNAGETQTPPLGPVPGISDMFFSADSSYLYVNVKGNPGMFTGYTAVYAVTNGAVARTATMVTPPDSVVLFGTALIPGTSNALVSDAGFGALILNLADLSAQPLALVNVTGQMASCWALVSTFTKTGFITDAEVNRLVEVDLSSGNIIQVYHPPTPFSGMTDIAASGSYLWALSAGNGSTAPSITTFDLSGGRGRAKFSSVFAIPGVTSNAQGLVVA